MTPHDQHFKTLLIGFFSVTILAAREDETNELDAHDSLVLGTLLDAIVNCED